MASEVEGKTEKEVAKYAGTFFQRFVEIKEWEKLLRRIEQGEDTPHTCPLSPYISPYLRRIE